MSTAGQKCSVSPSLARALVGAARIAPDDKVVVAGASALELLVALLRHGVADADCRSAEEGPHPPTGAAGVVIAPSVDSESELCRVLRRFVPSLRPDGTLVIAGAAPGNGRAARRLRHLVIGAGFVSVECIPAGAGERLIWVAHKKPLALAKAA